MQKKTKNGAARTAAVLAAAGILLLSAGCGDQNTVRLETAAAAEETEEETGAPGSAGSTEEGAETAAESGGDAGEGSAAPEKDTEAERIWVHVCGAVNRPGVYALAPGSRVYEAVEAAGGMASDAAGDYLNLVQPLADGSKVTVPFLSDLEEGQQYGLQDAGGSQNGTAGSEEDALVDINRADREELMTLPGIGEVRADAVISYREEHGAFERPEDIMLVPGIKEAAYEKLKDKITVR